MDVISDIANYDGFYEKRMARTIEEAARWSVSWHDQFKERYKIHTIPQERIPDLQKALDEWDRISSRAITQFFGDSEGLVDWFNRLLKNLDERKILPDRLEDWDGYPLPSKLDANRNYVHFRTTTEWSCRTVRTIGWCEGFGFFLPRAISDHQLRKRTAYAGAAMSAIFYLEQLSKQIDLNRMKYDRNDWVLTRIEACWLAAIDVIVNADKRQSIS